VPAGPSLEQGGSRRRVDGGNDNALMMMIMHMRDDTCDSIMFVEYTRSISS
jgi:hypothetical protein